MLRDECAMIVSYVALLRQKRDIAKEEVFFSLTDLGPCNQTAADHNAVYKPKKKNPTTIHLDRRLFRFEFDNRAGKAATTTITPSLHLASKYPYNTATVCSREGGEGGAVVRNVVGVGPAKEEPP